MTNARKVRALTALGSVIALGALAQGGVASSVDTAANDGAVIKAKANLEKEKVFFKGPDTVKKGQKLEFKVKTNVADVGPHTFSLVQEKTLPALKKKELKACFESGICGEIAGWHEVEFSEEDPEQAIVHRPTVKAGKSGWDRLGNFKREGDTVYLETKGESFTQKVTAKQGSTLYYICAIHPEMQGKIKVTG